MKASKTSQGKAPSPKRGRKPRSDGRAAAAAGDGAAGTLSVREALEIAIEFERKVRDCYARGAQTIKDTAGSKVFTVLAREEQSHVDYLEKHLAEWSATGALAPTKLTSILPTPEWVRAAEAKHRGTAGMRRIAEQNELELLKTAVQLEQDAATFYHDLVRRLPPTYRALFEQFLTIEDGHLIIVQAELDAVEGWGYWFDVQEFALEAQ